ncbi:MAG: UDP-N-acetylmuramate--L-alanine ligase [bacterium]
MHNQKIPIEKELKLAVNLPKSTKFHFIGLGGIGMSGLAKFLLELGFRVSGSDIADSKYANATTKLGGTVFIGHHPQNIGDASIIIASSAIKTDNPEYVEALNKNLPIYHRSQLLAALMEGLGLNEGVNQVSIGAAGTHGKTTTSGMASFAFEECEKTPSVVVGGIIPFMNTNAKYGNGNYFIAELDESDGTIEFYTPDYTIVTNLEHDHPDHYTDGLEQVISTFECYTNKLKDGQKLILNVDCPGNLQLLNRIAKDKAILYSIDEKSELHSKAKYRGTDIKLSGFNNTCKVYKNDEYLGELKLTVPGIHNISNALSVIAAAVENGLEFSEVTKALTKFTGMKRRFQILGEINGAKIIDDYAHHPTEIKATLSAAKEITKTTKSGRVIAVFQPHRYSRLENFWDEFVASFDDADVVYICDVYSAGEAPRENISSENLVEHSNHPNIRYVSGSIERISNIVFVDLEENDLLISMGAGNITKLGHLMMEKCF